MKKTTKILYKADKTTGKTTVRKDILFSALPAGLRQTKWGTIYYEGRKNRSDRNPLKKL